MLGARTTAWLVYDSAGAARNAWLIGHYVEVSKRLGLEVQPVIADTPEELPHVSALDGRAPDLIIARTMDLSVRRALDAYGVPVHNNLATAETCNDKWRTHRFALEHGIPVLQTELLGEPAPSLELPMVIKPVDGHGGEGVRLVHTEAECAHVRTNLTAENNGARQRRYLAQEVASTIGVDRRIYVLGGEILAVMERRSTTTASDLRANFTLGATATPISLDDLGDGAREIVAKVTAAVAPSLIGVDLLPHDGGWVLGEIEDVVGARMLYQHTRVDVVEEYCRWLVRLR